MSVVVYRTDAAVLLSTLRSLLAAAKYARDAGRLERLTIDLVHNAEQTTATDAEFTALIEVINHEAVAQDVRFRLFEGHGNIGYGRGHNLSIMQADSDYHLVLNPDVTLSDQSLAQGLQYLQQTPQVAALSPAVRDGDGNRQYVCKRFPTVLDFLLRGFAPGFIRRLFKARLARYEMRELSEQSASTDIPIISGCFMLFRTPVLQSVHGFDERYFLYFEDFDLSLRVHDKGTLAYLPAMQITHLGGNSARKGLSHIRMFARSGIRFYNTHGWKLL